MTTDPFTTAARAYAQERYPSGSDLDRDRRMVVDEFTVWARAHLAAHEPTEAEVEAAANAIIALVPGETEETAAMDDIDQAWDHARAALSVK